MKNALSSLRLLVPALALAVAFFARAETACSTAFGREAIRTQEAFDSVAIPYFESGRPGTMLTPDGLKIRYRKFPASTTPAKGVIVVVSGRTEFMRKYAEVVYDLRDSGYEVVLYDHRGQGESDRMTADPRKGHVRDFQDYANDLAQLIREVANPARDKKVHVLGHSMGGGTTMRLLLQQPDLITSFATSSPLVEPNVGAYPQRVALGVMESMSMIGRGDSYAPGRGPDEWDAGFDGNTVTGSRFRFDYTLSELHKHPELMVSGPTVSWVAAAIRNGLWLRKNIDKARTPMLILAGADEQVVRLEATDSLCAAAGPACKLVKLDGAKHEVLMETDAHRGAALRQALDFFDAH